MPQQNDIGIVLHVTLRTRDQVLIPLQTSTARSLVLQLPDGTEVTRTASLYTDGSDGRIYYTTIAADLAQVGNVGIQALIVTSTQTFRSTCGYIEVRANV